VPPLEPQDCRPTAPGANQNRVVKRITGLPFRIGGEEHSGWLPPGAAKPLPTPVRDLLVDLEIEFDGAAYFLFCEAQDGSFRWDTWHQSLADAELCAAETYGIQAGQWTQCPED
jgi:hypothetical protein